MAEPTPDLATFRALAARHTVIPVSREILSDGLSPVLAFARLGPGATYLLESVTGGEKWARYSFVGAEPDLFVRGRGDTLELRDARGTRTLRGVRPFEELRTLLRGYRPAPVPELPRFSGGAVGYVAWEAIRHFEPKAIARPDDRPESAWDFSFAIGGPLVVFDAVRQTARVIVPAHVTEGDDLEARYRAAEARIAEIIARLGAPSALPALDPPVRGAPAPALPRSTFETREAFEAAVVRAQEHIAAGDVFQVVLSQRFHRPSTGDLFDAYRTLRVLNPSPYMYFLRFPEVRVAGASPETLVRLEHGVAEVRPIAGTRPRGKTPEEDARREAELRADPKERAEHVMLVDLGRNDLGRVSRPGTVRVGETLAVERYSHVMHLVSTVTGELREGLDALDVLAATFPAGTLSGAPKVRAMQIIDALEPAPRFLYGGAVGYLGWDGNLDLAITIRTIVEEDGEVRVQAGAGIVEASDPRAEHDETVHKASAALAALGSARRDAT